MWWASVRMAIVGAFRASSAIRCSFVETLSRVCVLFIFPSSDSHARLHISLPSTGSLGLVPPFRRYYGELRRLVAHPASLRFLRFAVSPLVRIFAHCDRVPFAAPGRDQRLVLSAFSVKTVRPPRFSGAPCASAAAL